MLLYTLDLVGVAVFAVSGALAAGRKDLDLLGVVRDVLSAEVPYILRRGNLYASAAIAGTAVYFLLDALGAAYMTSTIAGMAVVAGVRLASIWWRLQLPVFRHRDDDTRSRDSAT